MVDADKHDKQTDAEAAEVAAKYAAAKAEREAAKKAAALPAPNPAPTPEEQQVELGQPAPLTSAESMLTRATVPTKMVIEDAPHYPPYPADEELSDRTKSEMAAGAAHLKKHHKRLAEAAKNESE